LGQLLRRVQSPAARFDTSLGKMMLPLGPIAALLGFDT
jgi:hypothetical protein